MAEKRKEKRKAEREKRWTNERKCAENT